MRSAGQSIATHSSVAAVVMSALTQGHSQLGSEACTEARSVTFVSDMEIVALEGRRLRRAARPRRRSRHPHAKEPAADTPGDDATLFQRGRHESVTVWRPGQGRHGPLVALEDVEAGRSLDIVDDRRPLVRAHCDALRLAMKVDTRVSRSSAVSGEQAL